MLNLIIHYYQVKFRATIAGTLIPYNISYKNINSFHTAESLNVLKYKEGIKIQIGKHILDPFIAVGASIDQGLGVQLRINF